MRPLTVKDVEGYRYDDGLWIATIDALRVERDALRDRVAEMEGHLSMMLKVIENANYGAFENGNRSPCGSIDEGEVLTGRVVEEARRALEGCGA